MQKKKLLEKPTALVKHRPSIKNKVQKAVVGTDLTIGEFYDMSAEKELKKLKSK